MTISNAGMSLLQAAQFPVTPNNLIDWKRCEVLESEPLDQPYNKDWNGTVGVIHEQNLSYEP